MSIITGNGSTGVSLLLFILFNFSVIVGNIVLVSVLYYHILYYNIILVFGV